jgi:hypothetical protein
MQIVSNRKTAPRLPVRVRRARAVLLGLAFALAGCGSTVSQLPVVGLPEGMPPAPESAPATPPVGVSRGERTGKPLTAEERAKLESELAAARTGAAANRRKQIQRSD